MTSDYDYLRGKIYDFEDGVKLHVVDVKWRESGEWVTYETIYSHALPKRFSLNAKEFADKYGHLFPKQ
jgi:hypothetical protein